MKKKIIAALLAATMVAAAGYADTNEIRTQQMMQRLTQQQKAPQSHR